MKKALLTGFFFVGIVYSQEAQIDIESLENSYINRSYPKSHELIILLDLVNGHKEPSKILKYSELLIKKATKADSVHYLFDANLQRGLAYRLKSDLSKALEYFSVATEIAKKNEDISNLAIANITLGDVYSEMDNHDSAISYYTVAIEQLRDLISDPEDFLQTNPNQNIQTLERNLASALLNAGDEFLNAGKYERALGFFYESSALCKKINYKIGSAYNLGNIGMVYAKQNKPRLAEANINEAIKILEESKDYYPISVYLNYISDIYMNLNLPGLAVEYSKRSLELASKYQLKDEIREANLKLSKIYDKLDRPDSSLYHLREYVKYQDSLQIIYKNSAEKTSKLEVSKKQVEVDLLKQKGKNEQILTYSFLGGLVFVSGLAFGLYRRNKYISETKKIIDEEKQKSDGLLLNILPKETADELRKFGRVEAKKYESVTVLFTDFKDFTKYAENSPPEKLVESVDMYFSEFDKIIEKYNLEKIKTIGDAYMCAGGLPEQTDNHADLMIQAAIDIVEFVEHSKKVYAVSDIRFDIRIGIHTGPVVAGVVGKNKFSYDIWGDTVNVASRIESSSEPGKINVSESTYKLLKDNYSFESRGEIKIKNRSPVKMYYLSKN